MEKGKKDWARQRQKVRLGGKIGCKVLCLWGEGKRLVLKSSGALPGGLALVYCRLRFVLDSKQAPRRNIAHVGL